jgi:Sec-independent protein translocase protein TatA
VEFLGLSPAELFVIAIVAVLVFGARLPQAAGEAAATLQRFRRSLSDLRRETGIDQEIARARREFESVRRPLAVDLPDTIRREVKALDPGPIGADPVPPPALSQPALSQPAPSQPEGPPSGSPPSAGNPSAPAAEPGDAGPEPTPPRADS